MSTAQYLSVAFTAAAKLSVMRVKAQGSKHRQYSKYQQQRARRIIQTPRHRDSPDLTAEQTGREYGGSGADTETQHRRCTLESAARQGGNEQHGIDEPAGQPPPAHAEQQ